MCRKGGREPCNRSSPALGSSLTGGAQRGASKSQKTRQRSDLEGSKQRKLHFSAHEQLMDCGPQTDSGLGREPGVEGGVADKPSQRATLAAQRAGREAQCGRRGQGWVPRGRHSDLGSAHRPHGTAERTNTPLRQSAGSEKKQTPSNPAAQRPAGGAKCAHARDRGRTSGTQSRAHKPRDTEDGLRGLRMCSGG